MTLRSIVLLHYYVLTCSTCTPPPLFLFFFNHPATTEIYTLSLHDALPIYPAALQASPAGPLAFVVQQAARSAAASGPARQPRPDRKSTRLNSSHRCISYAVFCLKKKKKKKTHTTN